MFYTSAKISNLFSKRLLSFLLLLCCLSNSFAQQSALKEDSLVQKFYINNHQQLYWISSAKNMKSAFDWLTIIESANHFGLASNKVQINQIRTAFFIKFSIDSVFIAQTDRMITSMVLNFIKELQQGNLAFDYDEISPPLTTR